MKAVVRQNLRSDRILDFINISTFYSHKKITDLFVGTKKKSSVIYNMAIYGKSLYDGF